MAGRFFVDENDLALARQLELIYPGDIVYPSHPELPEVPRGMHDDDWLPLVASCGLVVITRDQRIRYRPVEKRMWMDHGVRGFVLTGRSSQSTVVNLEILGKRWSGMEAIVVERTKGPWMFAITAASMREIDLELRPPSSR